MCVCVCVCVWRKLISSQYGSRAPGWHFCPSGETENDDAQLIIAVNYNYWQEMLCEEAAEGWSWTTS